MHLDHSIPELALAAALTPVAAAAFAVTFRRRLPGRPLSHFLAAACVALIAYALSGPRISGFEQVPRVAVFALDASDSIGPSELEQAISSAKRIAAGLAADGVEVVFVAFDSGARRTDPDAPPERIREKPVSSRPVSTSALQPALLAASAVIGPRAAGRIHLFSDGRFSDPESCPCSGFGLPVWTHPLKPRGDVEVRIEELDYSRPAEEGAPTRVRVTLRSNAAGSGLLALETDGKEAGSFMVTLSPGIPLTQTFTDVHMLKGRRRLSARFQGVGGTPDAPAVWTDATVMGPPRVLIVDCPRMRGLAPLKALEAQEFDLNAVTWDRMGEIETFEEYDAVLVCPPDEPASTGDAGARIARFVAHGGGLLVLAGKTGFGPAWQGSPLGSISPVDPPPPAPPPTEDGKDPQPDPPDTPEKEPPPEPEPLPADDPDPPQKDLPVEVGDVAIVFLIDKSGSMAGAKIRLAREAAIAAATDLSDSSWVGVLAFDTEAQWLVPVTRAGERAWITDRISRLQAGGGTNIFPALIKSLAELKNLDARIKHVILISDGYNQTMEDFKGIILKMKDAGIGLSTIGVGEQFDTRLLSQLTYWAGPGKGRFEFTKDFNRIPRLVVDQTRWAVGDAPPAGKDPPPPVPPQPPPPMPETPPVPPQPREPDKPVEPEPRMPIRLKLTHPSPPFQDIPESSVPSVFGHRKASAARLADVLVVGPDGSAVIAVGEHELGRVLFVGLSFDEDWSPDWLKWEYLPKWMGQAVRWIKRRPEEPLPPGISFVEDRSGGVEIEIEADTSVAAPENPPLVLVRTSSGDRPLPVLRTGTHRFAAMAGPDLLEKGNTVRVEFPPGAGSSSMEAEAPLAVPIPFERAFLEPDHAALESISSATGGVFSPDTGRASSFPASNREKASDVSWLPLLAALSLIPVASWARRRQLVS